MTTSGETLKQLGMDLVLNHTAHDWKQRFLEAGRTIARTGKPFTAEDVIERVGTPPGSRNAIGAMMNSLAKKLDLVRVGYRPATRPSRHASIIAMWCMP